jgi:hypothetical protein
MFSIYFGVDNGLQKSYSTFLFIFMASTIWIIDKLELFCSDNRLKTSVYLHSQVLSTLCCFPGF